MLATLTSVLQKAHRGGYAVGAFNVNNLEILQAVLAAAHETRSPVIVQTSEGAVEYAGMDYLRAMITVGAKKTRVPVVFHLDHGKNLNLVRMAIRSGYTSVMFDGSTLPYAENVKKTKQIVALARRRDVSVEAELGALKGIEDLVSVSEKEANLTDPARAAEFVAKTGCNALAVAIGTSHGAYKFSGETKLDFDRLRTIKKNTGIPLVLHGASGVSPELVGRLHKNCERIGDCERLEGAKGVSPAAIKKAISLGINKINVDTDLRIAFTAAVRETLMTDKKAFDPRKLLGPARELMTEVVKEKMKLFGCAGKA